MGNRYFTGIVLKFQEVFLTSETNQNQNANVNFLQMERPDEDNFFKHLVCVALLRQFTVN